MAFAGAFAGGILPFGQIALLRNSGGLNITSAVTYELDTTLYDPFGLVVSNSSTIITLRNGSYWCELWFPADGQAGEIVYTLAGDGTDTNGFVANRSSCKPSFCLLNNETAPQISVFVSDADDLGGTVAANTGLLVIRRLP